jgi:hypothetical protein
MLKTGDVIDMKAFRRTLVAAVNALTIMTLTPDVSRAAFLGVDVDVDATFGLDQKTMDFINGLAPQVRVEVLRLLKEALPLIDTSVISYLNKVDTILDKQISHIQCAAIGAGAALSDDLKSKLPFGGQAQPVSKLETDLNTTITTFKPDVRPHDMRLAYSDLIYRATVTNCQVSLAPETAKDVAAILENARPRWMVWYRLDGSCSGITQCYSLQEKNTRKTISKADKRDVAAADAEKRMAHVQQPTTKATWFWTKTFDPTEYEKVLGELISVEDGVHLAEAKRRGEAKKSIDAAISTLATARQNINSSPKGPFDRRQVAYRTVRNCDQAKRALAISKSVLGDLASASQSVSTATTLDASLQSMGDHLSGEAAVLRKEAEAQATYATTAEYVLKIGAGFGTARLPCGLK